MFVPSTTDRFRSRGVQPADVAASGVTTRSMVVTAAGLTGLAGTDT